MPVLHERIALARRALAEAGIDSDEAAIDVEILARHVLGWDRARFLTNLRDPVPPALEPRFSELLARRVNREPVAYIIGHREFWGREFAVTPDVLVPRPETEIIVEEALDAARERDPFNRIIDVGTGSGCLAITLALEFPGATVLATDISAAALAVASHNAARHGVSARVAFLEADLVDPPGSDQGQTGVRPGSDPTSPRSGHGGASRGQTPLRRGAAAAGQAGVRPPFAAKRLRRGKPGSDPFAGLADLIVSNPPYMATADVEHLQPEVARYEPQAALFGGADGLDVIRRLCAAAPPHLAAGGLLVVEFGFGQDAGVREIAQTAGWQVVRIRADLQGIPRTAVLRR